MRGPAAALCALLLSALASAASAQPSIWDKARDPAAELSHQRLVAVERMLQRADDASQMDVSAPGRFRRTALALLEFAGNGRLLDPRLKILLAELLMETSNGSERKARALLEQALREDPQSPFRAQALFQIAIASAKLGDSKREYQAYTQALDVTWDPMARTVVYMNRAESSMVLGRLDESIAGYRQALALAQNPEHRALSFYGLGIALERRGDLPSALDAMRSAYQIPVGPGSALDLASVFFVPEYDLWYYKALEAMAQARFAKKPERVELSLKRAVAYWERYLDGARSGDQRWLRNAELHRQSCENKLAKLKKSTPAARAK